MGDTRSRLSSFTFPRHVPIAPCGFLVLDKPVGHTSHDCVARVRRAYGLRRVGHGGTLDPAVTGVLPLALGPATRLLPYLRSEKAYVGEIQLGVFTSTDDLDGVVMATGAVPVLTAAILERALDGFRGLIQQRPPRVSAVHVAGERAYARARRGEEPDLPPRAVTIHQLDLLEWNPIDSRLRVAVRCSAGTYIRSLARDLGALLGCGGCLASLRRSEALGFTLRQAVPIEELLAHTPPPLDPLDAFGHVPRQSLSGEELAGWRCGRRLAAAEPLSSLGSDLVVAVLNPDGSLAGIARSDGSGGLRPRVVFDAAG